MVTPSELLRVLLGPVLVAAVVAGVGRWRGWAWAMPLAAGAGFATGYALIGVPRLPPIDGNDWLFWLIAPVTLLGVADAWVDRRWGWVFAAIGAGLMALVIALPLVHGAVTTREVATTCGVMTAVAAVLWFAMRAAEPRVTPTAVVAALCVVTGAAAVVVMSSGLRILGVYGIAAAAALAPVAVLIGRTSSRGVAVTAVSVLTGLLVASRYYAYPSGISALNLAVLLASPVLLLAGAFVPAKNHTWVRGVVAVIAVAIAVGAVAVPTALRAKSEAEATQDDPYAEYYGQ